MAGATSTVRAGGRRVGARKTTADAAARKERAANIKKEDKQRKKNIAKQAKTVKSKRQWEETKQQCKKLLIGGGVLALVAAGIAMLIVTQGDQLPDPQTAIDNATKAILDVATLRNVALVILAGGVMVIAYYGYQYYKAQQRAKQADRLQTQLRAAKQQLAERRVQQALEAKEYQEQYEQLLKTGSAEARKLFAEQAKERDAALAREEEEMARLRREEAAILREIESATHEHSAESAAWIYAQQQSQKEKDARRRGKVIVGLEAAQFADMVATDDESEDESQDSDDNHDTPLQVALEPIRMNNTHAVIDFKVWTNTATAQATSVEVELACDRCGTSTRVSLSGAPLCFDRRFNLCFCTNIHKLLACSTQMLAMFVISYKLNFKAFVCNVILKPSSPNPRFVPGVLKPAVTAAIAN
eukprot:m.110094 g.110094  ORF g.110094 m.110094 type:complete len:415 (-) comp13386_c0_seq3:838-2082(-)